MSSFDAFLLIGEVTVLLYLLWRVLDLTFDAIEQWQAAWRDQKHADQARAEDLAKPPSRAEASGLR